MPIRRVLYIVVLNLSETFPNDDPRGKSDATGAGISRGPGEREREGEKRLKEKKKNQTRKSKIPILT